MNFFIRKLNTMVDKAKKQKEVNLFSKGDFSLNNLKTINPGLTEFLLWHENPWTLEDSDHRIKLHIGCGGKIIDGFVNVDFIPCKPEVLKWNLLNFWPSKLNNLVEMAFSEDVLEHFYYNEQLYILCSMNLLLQPNKVFRVLMPDLDKLVKYAYNFASNNLDDCFVKNLGIKTGSDALNMGMRFGGHRWLHNQDSLELMCKLCGFKTYSTTCSESTFQELSNLNIRDETNSLSFANDLIKDKSIGKLNINPSHVINSTLIEQIGIDCYLYKSNNNDPQIVYNIPKSLNAEQIILMNFRGANLSEFNEHNYAKVYLKASEKESIYCDSSLRSSYSCNLISNSQIISKIQSKETIKVLRFDPTEKKDEYFTVGPLEIFFV